ncbi:MAG: hypothetical protein NXI22_20325 [bacterium]|nr:hypothetical protein [bacterium]
MKHLLFTLLALSLFVATIGCGPAGGVTKGGPLTPEEIAANAEREKQVQEEERAHFQKK